MGVCQQFEGWKRTMQEGMLGNRIRVPRLQERETSGTRPLLADAEPGNDGLVPFRVVLLQIVEQATPLADKHEQTAA